VVRCGARQVARHQQCGRLLADAAGPSDAVRENQPVAVFDHHVALIGELALLAAGLLSHPGVRVGR